LLDVRVEETRVVRTFLVIGLIASAVALSGSRADASPIVFYGADSGVAPGGSSPNAAAAAAAFHAAAGTTSLIDFENAPIGTFATLPLAPGVTVSLTGDVDGGVTFGAGITNADRASNEALGYNTTPGGSQHLRATATFDSQSGLMLTFSFAQPIQSFGAFFSDTEIGYPGPLHVSFFDGTSQFFEIGKTDTGGGTLFWGVTNLGAPISSISFSTGATGFTRDIWGIDDVSYEVATVPEPASLLLVGAGLFGLARRYRTRSRRP
jgi:hypothetical protein